MMPLRPPRSRRARPAGSRRATTSRSRPRRMATWEHSRRVHPVRWRGSLTLVLGADPRRSPSPAASACTDLADLARRPRRSPSSRAGDPGSTTSSSARSSTPRAGNASCSSAPDPCTERPRLDHRLRRRRRRRHRRPGQPQQALQEQTDRYRLLLELSPDGIVVHENGLIRWANQAAADFVGVARPQRLPRRVAHPVHPSGLAARDARAHRFPEGGRGRDEAGRGHAGPPRRLARSSSSRSASAPSGTDAPPTR